MAKDRKPLLADLFLAYTQTKKLDEWVVPRKTAMHVANTLRTAKRFVLDSEASRYIGEMEKAVPKALVYAQEFAIQPFKTMYVEFDNAALWSAVNKGKDVQPDMDGRLGYMYDDGRVYVIAGNWEESPREAMIMPISYGLFRPMETKQEMLLAENLQVSRLALDQFFWGSLWHDVNPVDQRAFRANHSARLEVKPEYLVESLDHGITAVSAIFNECAGELRNIIAILLFLNRTSDTRYEDHVPMRQTMIGTKPSAMLSHSVVHFKLNPTPLFHESWGTGSAWRREHDVRGHFCHDKVSKAWCNAHDWSEIDVNRWKCLKCGGQKWWRKEHRRGHRDKGMMQTTYEVHK